MMSVEILEKTYQAFQHREEIGIGSRGGPIDMILTRSKER